MAYFADDGYLTCSWCGNPDDDRIFGEPPRAPWMHLNCERLYSEFFREEHENFYAVEVLKFVRGEASAIMPGTVGEAEAKIAKVLIGMNPSLALPENLQQLVFAVEAVSGGSPPSWPTYRLWWLNQREICRARGYFIEESFNNARESFSVNASAEELAAVADAARKRWREVVQDIRKAKVAHPDRKLDYVPLQYERHSLQMLLAAIQTDGSVLLVERNLTGEVQRLHDNLVERYRAAFSAVEAKLARIDAQEIGEWQRELERRRRLLARYPDESSCVIEGVVD